MAWLHFVVSSRFINNVTCTMCFGKLAGSLLIYILYDNMVMV